MSPDTFYEVKISQKCRCDPDSTVTPGDRLQFSSKILYLPQDLRTEFPSLVEKN